MACTVLGVKVVDFPGIAAFLGWLLSPLTLGDPGICTACVLTDSQPPFPAVIWGITYPCLVTEAGCSPIRGHPGGPRSGAGQEVSTSESLNITVRRELLFSAQCVGCQARVSARSATAPAQTKSEHTVLTRLQSCKASYRAAYLVFHSLGWQLLYR